MAHIPENLGKGLSQLPAFNAQHTRHLKVIGIAGTAKNTGKTTTLNCLLQEAFHRKIAFGLTSIGYDGEEIDNITFLPKPRINVYPNSIVTTSEQCLNSSSAGVEILDRTGMFTALGEILILRVLSAGMIVIAGPGKKNELHSIIEKMKRYELESMFVDGSLNRIAPMSVVDSIIFTTGGSRSNDIAVLCDEMRAIESLFQYPIVLSGDESKAGTIEVPLLLEVRDVDKLISGWIQENTTLYISRFISPIALERLISLTRSGTKIFHKIIFPDPFALLMNGNIVQTAAYIKELINGNISITFCHRPKFCCITANPFTPQYIGNKYIPHYLDSDELLNHLRSSCLTPVFNTRETESSVLFDSCYK